MHKTLYQFRLTNRLSQIRSNLNNLCHKKILAAIVSAIFVESKTRVTRYKLRGQIHELRVQIQELRVPIHDLQVRTHELRVQIHKLEN